jgi:hypothetical protein
MPLWATRTLAPAIKRISRFSEHTYCYIKNKRCELKMS